MRAALGYNSFVTNIFCGLRAALFDLDGTLIETHIDFARMRSETLALAARYGVRDEGLAKLDILTIVETARERLETAGRTEEGKRFREEAFSLLEEIEIGDCANPIPIPGASQLLKDLRARGVSIGIVTRNCRTVAQRLLASADLICDALLTRNDVPRTKPDPSHLYAALSVMGLAEERALGVEDSALTSPGTGGLTPAVMIGDHWMDIQAGRAAKLKTVGILRGRTEEFFAPAPPDILVQELADLLPLLDLSGSTSSLRHL